MIIIETKNGPVLLNDREVRGMAFDKANNEAIVTFANDMPQRMLAKQVGLTSKFEDRTMTIADVEHVRYTGDKCSENYTYKGSMVDTLEKVLEIERSRIREMKFHSGFTRNWFFIFHQAFDEIKKSQKAQKDGKNIFRSIDSIIEQAEREYDKSVEEYEKKTRQVTDEYLRL